MPKSNRQNKTVAKLRVYFAAPLFTQAEWQWNLKLASELRKLKLEVILPQDRAEPMLTGDERFNAQTLFHANVSEIERCDVVLAVFDHADPDSGTSWECGYAYKASRPVIGLRTDLRAGGDDSDRPVNLMLSIGCREFLVVPPNKRNDVGFIARELRDLIAKTTTTD